MSLAPRHVAPLALMLASASVAACRAREEPPPPSPAARGADAADRPVDRVVDGELAEGTESAFGLPVPRRMRVDARFADEVFARGPLSLEQLTNYVRARVIAAHVETGPVKTVFTGVTVKSAPQRVVRVEITRLADATELLVRDETREPAEPGLTPAERYRQLGLDPNGNPLDPTHLQ